MMKVVLVKITLGEKNEQRNHKDDILGLECRPNSKVYGCVFVFLFGAGGDKGGWVLEQDRKCTLSKDHCEQKR